LGLNRNNRDRKRDGRKEAKEKGDHRTHSQIILLAALALNYFSFRAVVAQTSESAVSRISNPPRLRPSTTLCRLEVRDTADSEVCATWTANADSRNEPTDY
jgi:hypothetical protein